MRIVRERIDKDVITCNAFLFLRLAVDNFGKRSKRKKFVVTAQHSHLLNVKILDSS